MSHSPRLAWWKRPFDVVIASVALILLSPVFIAVSVAVLVSMGKPILFTQSRPGLRGQPFQLYKFRSMRAATDGEIWFRSDAQRVTRLGNFLRRTTLDELPELWNVLRGDMSIVGPRPLLMEYLPKYTAEQMRRHEVRPGLTGWAVVHGRQTLPFSERLRLDVWYIDHLTFWLDIKTIFMTIRSIFSRQGVLVGQSIDDVDDLGLAPDHGGSPPEAPP